MTHYFALRYKMINRQWLAFGLPPLVGYVLAFCSFIILSHLLFFKLAYAAYIYTALGLGGVLWAGGNNQQRDFLRSAFENADFFRIRIIENLLFALPFVAFLLFKTEIRLALLLLGLATLFAFTRTFRGGNFPVPTPFYQYPFEFLVGFRTIWAFVILGYILLIIAIRVTNFNLGAFTFAIHLFAAIFFYANTELKFFVWIYAENPFHFLRRKYIQALGYLFLFSLPIGIGLGIFFPQESWVLLILWLIGGIYMGLIICAKYSTYPHAMSVPESLLIVLSIIFPPVLLGVFPFFYRKSIERLNEILQ